MKAILIVMILLIAAAIMGCNERRQGDDNPRKSHSKPLLMPSSSGNPYEIMIVCEDSLWDGYTGAAIRHLFNKPVPMLPQQEPSFNLSHVTNKHYDKITNLFRSIILIKIDPYYVEPKISIERDLFSYPQLIMTISGQSNAAISAFITEKTKYLLGLFSTEEINRECIRLETSHNIKFDKQVYDMFGCHMNIPVDIKKMKIGKDFIWASDDGLSSIQNICIYSYPYVSERVFNRGVYIALRDSFMKANIPGEHEGSHMATNREFCIVEDINIQGHYVQAARGLWEMTGEAMGGPFVAHSQVDTINNRVIVVEGFVYAPDKMKRTMIRRLEAALYTLDLPKAANQKLKIEN